MKSCCVVSFVFNKKYQCFIPLYVLSIAKAYPEFDIRVYFEGKLTNKVEKSINYLKKIFPNIFLISLNTIDLGFTHKANRFQQINRCKRWCLFDPVFMNYSGVYIGDIDLLIFKEKPNLLEQHIEHCTFINRSFSNIARIGKPIELNVKKKLKMSIKYGLKHVKLFIGKYNSEVIKFSGLHFVIPSKYYPIINKTIGQKISELNDLANKKSDRYNLCNFNNEQFLRDLIIESGFNDLNIVTNNDYNISKNPYSFEFRPHHGIHLGIFRSDQLIRFEKKLIFSSYYQNFYKQFEELTKTVEFAFIRKYFNIYLKRILRKINDTYKGDKNALRKN